MPVDAEEPVAGGDAPEALAGGDVDPDTAAHMSS